MLKPFLSTLFDTVLPAAIKLLLPILIGAIKELKSENDALKKRLDDAKL